MHRYAKEKVITSYLRRSMRAPKRRGGERKGRNTDQCEIKWEMVREYD